MKIILMKGQVVSVNVSSERGTQKMPVEFAKVSLSGIENDSGVGKWNYQVSILSEDSMVHHNKKHGGFAENIRIKGINMDKVKPLDRFIINDELILEVTCTADEIRDGLKTMFQTGNNIDMPKGGVYCRVLKGGEITPGMDISLLPKVMNTMIIILNDKVKSGLYDDKCGPLISGMLDNYFKSRSRLFNINEYLIRSKQKELWVLLQEYEEHDVIITVGSTGLGSKDIAYETIKSEIDKEIPGIMEHCRVKCASMNPLALLDRSIAGIKNKCLIYSLPADTEELKIYMSEILNIFENSIYMVYDLDVR